MERESFLGTIGMLIGLLIAITILYWVGFIESWYGGVGVVMLVAIGFLIHKIPEGTSKHITTAAFCLFIIGWILVPAIMGLFPDLRDQLIENRILRQARTAMETEIPGGSAALIRKHHDCDEQILMFNERLKPAYDELNMERERLVRVKIDAAKDNRLLNDQEKKDIKANNDKLQRLSQEIKDMHNEQKLCQEAILAMIPPMKASPINYIGFGIALVLLCGSSLAIGVNTNQPWISKTGQAFTLLGVIGVLIVWLSNNGMSTVDDWFAIPHGAEIVGRQAVWWIFVRLSFFLTLIGAVIAFIRGRWKGALIALFVSACILGAGYIGNDLLWGKVTVYDLKNKGEAIGGFPKVPN